MWAGLCWHTACPISCCVWSNLRGPCAQDAHVGRALLPLRACLASQGHPEQTSTYLQPAKSCRDVSSWRAGRAAGWRSCLLPREGRETSQLKVIEIDEPVYLVTYKRKAFSSETDGFKCHLKQLLLYPRKPHKLWMWITQAVYKTESGNTFPTPQKAFLSKAEREESKSAPISLKFKQCYWIKLPVAGSWTEVWNAASPSVLLLPLLVAQSLGDFLGTCNSMAPLFLMSCKDQKCIGKSEQISQLQSQAEVSIGDSKPFRV